MGGGVRVEDTLAPVQFPRRDALEAVPTVRAAELAHVDPGFAFGTPPVVQLVVPRIAELALSTVLRTVSTPIDAKPAGNALTIVDPESPDAIDALAVVVSFFASILLVCVGACRTEN